MKKINQLVILLGSAVLLVVGLAGRSYAVDSSATQVQSDYAKDIQTGEAATANDKQAQENQQGAKENENFEAQEEAEHANVNENIDNGEATESTDSLNSNQSSSTDGGAQVSGQSSGSDQSSTSGNNRQ